MITGVNTFGLWLDKELQARGLSQRKLALSAGVSPSMVSEVVNNNRNAGWDFCAAIAKPLGKTPMEMFILAELLPGGGEKKLTEQRAEYYARSLSDDEAKLIELFRQATDADRNRILVIVQGLLFAARGEEL